MTSVCFLRHGETENNVKGIVTGQSETKLSEKGIEDAKEKAKELTDDFDLYYCSPLGRTQHTLKLIKGNVPYENDDRIIDIKMGEWEGVLKSNLDPEEHKAYKQRKFLPDGAETFEEVDERILSFLEDIFNKHKDKKVLVITHQIIIRFLKQMFYDKIEDVQNLEIFEVTDEMFKKLKNR